jgi:RNA polymerase sigma-70 factor (ECF subfamily)
VTSSDRTDGSSASRRALYDEAVALYGSALARLARSYEFDRDRREDLLQEIHLALWRSFERFDGRCALRTWVYRVAHNVGTTHVVRDHRQRKRTFLTLDALADTAAPDDAESTAARRVLLEQVSNLLLQLNPLDRELMLLYLEGLDAATIGEVTGFSASNVATKVHRIKKILGQRLRETLGGANA